MTGDLKAERVESRVTFVETRRPLGYDEDDINEVNTDASSESAGKTTRLWLKGHASVLTPKREKCGATLPAAASDFADTKWRDSSSSEKPRSRRLRGDTVDLYKEPSQSLTLASSLEEFAPSNPSSATSSTAADSPEFAGRQNRWRQTARLVANSRGMEAAISILILANCVTMALYIPERPLEAAKEVRFLFTTGWGVIDAADTNATYTAPTTQDADSSGATEETSPMTLLDAADILFTTCFVGELALRIFGQGFIFPRKTAYLRSPWNVVDFCIVSVNFLMLFEVGPNLSAIRLLRIFKVLLMVDRFPGLKNMVSSAVDSVRSLANLGLMLLFIVVMYSIWSLQMWRGQWLYVCSPGTRDGESNYRGAIESYPPSEGPQLSPPRGYMQPLINEAGKSSFDNTDPPKPNVEACVTTLSSYKTLQTASLSTRLRLLALSTQEVEGVKPFDGQPAPSFSLKEPSSRDQDTGLPPAEPIVGSPQLPNTNGRWPNPLKRGSSRQEGVQSNGGSPGLAAAELPAASKRPSHAFSASGDGMPPWQFVTASERSLLSNETDDSGHDHGTRRTNQASTDTSVNVSRWLTATAAPLKSDNDLSGTPEPLFRRRSSLHDAVDHTAKAVDRRLGQTGELAFASEKKYPAGTQVPEHRLLSRLNGVVTLLIVLNLATLSAAHYSQPRGLTVVINIVNLATLAFFAVELVVKLWILKAEYFADGFNCIDLASVVVSVASLFLGFFIEASSRSFIIFRAVRTVRVFRALRSFPSISRQAEGVMGAARRSVNMLLMVALFLFTIALLFMHLYGASRQRWLAPQITFSTFPLSLLTSLQVMTGDDWDAIMMESVYQTSAASAVPFVLARFIGDILFTKMFLAVVMEHYEVIQRVAKSATRLLPKRQTMVTRHKQNLESALEQHDKVQPETLASIVSRKALLIPCEYRHTPQLCDAYMQGLLSSTDASGITTAYLANEFRGRELVKAHARGCRAKMTSDGTGLCNLLGWSASVAGLRAVQCKRHLSNDEASFFVFSLSARQWAASITQNQRFDELAAFLAFCSCVTVAVAPAKTIWIVDAMDCSITGFFAVEAMLKSIALGFVKGKGAYLKNGWNVFDFSVLIVSVVSIVFGSLNWQIGIVFRPLRAVRPLRLIKRWKRIRHVAIALIRSLPGLITIVVLVLLIYVLFAIVAVDSLGGQFYVCSLPEVTNRSACQGEGWVQYSGVESIPVELVIDEGEEATPYIKLVAAEWLRLPQHFDHLGAALRTLLVFGTLSKWRALVDTALATCGVENAVGSCAGSNYFAGIMLLTFLLIANFIALPAFTSEVILMYATVRKEMEHTSDYSGRELSYFYMMKLLLLMRPSISLIPRKSRGARLAYRIVTNKWFDNFVGVSILINTITMALEYEGMPDDYAHVLMYVDNSFTFLTKGIQLLFETLFVSISDLWANLFFYGIILTVYALVGVGLFHDVRRLPQGFDHNVNFDNVFSAILTLHRVATGDNWSAMLDNAMVAPPFCSEEVGECGFPTIAPVFFMSFKALSYVVTVVLFIATVLENYRAMSKLSGLKGGMDEIRELHQTWSMLFSDADVIPTQQVQRLLAVMGTEKGPPSFSVPLHYSRCHILDTLSKFQILDHQGKVHFSEVLLEVAFYKVQAVGKGISRREWWSFENDWHRL
eukprot:gene18644-28761_t